MAYTAAAMYGAAVFDGAIEGFLPGDPSFSLIPIVIVAVIAGILLAIGRHMPDWALATLGPLGVGLIAYALATTPHPGDGAALYALPVLWTSVFYGKRGAIGIVVCVGLAHGIALLELPTRSSYPGRWVDVMVAVTAIAWVALVLERRNEHLLAELLSESRTDLLTHLLNRRGFEERASVELAHARRLGARFALVTFDIDYFKQINDEWGHEVGDRVLAWIGEVLAVTARDIDIVARLGGEEFVVLLPATATEGARTFADRVRATLAAGGPDSIPIVRISAGVAIAEGPVDIEDVLQRADMALYDAKRGGRDRTVVFGERIVRV